MNSITKMLFAALAVIAAGSMFVLGGSTAHAQTPGGPGILLIEKICVDAEGDVVDVDTEFELLADVELDLVEGTAPEFLIDDLTIGCGEVIELSGLLALIDLEILPVELTDDLCTELGLGDVFGDDCTFEELLAELGEGALDDLIAYVADNIGSIDTATLSITEVDGLAVLEGCEIDILSEALWTEFLTEGLVCTITNTVVVDADLTVTKECPSGAGTGTFNIVIDGDANVFGCGTTVTLEDVPAGDTVTITEIIGGSDEYATSIDCDNGEDAAGTTLDVTLEGEDVSCTVTNIFTDDGLTDEEIAEILQALNFELDLEIEIKNILNNINENINANENDNENNNINENTQNQTNDQNTDVSTGDVNVSSGGGEGTGTGTGTGSGTGTIIKPPSTGSAGLADTGTGFGLSTGVLVAAVGLLGTLSLAAVRFAGVRG